MLRANLRSEPTRMRHCIAASVNSTHGPLATTLNKCMQTVHAQGSKNFVSACGTADMVSHLLVDGPCLCLHGCISVGACYQCSPNPLMPVLHMRHIPHPSFPSTLLIPPSAPHPLHLQYLVAVRTSPSSVGGITWFLLPKIYPGMLWMPRWGQG